MFFSSPESFMSWEHKAVTVFGMSGVGKTTVASMLRDDGWFHYSVDYRIGTRYMGEFIVDNFKRQAMKVPFLRDLLISDSIRIDSNLSFHNLDPLSTYLGKPGDPARGGLPFAEYRRRQEQHRIAETQAMGDVPIFIDKARDIYGYRHFICDCSGSLCHVVNPEDPYDLVMTGLGEHSLILYIRGTAAHADMLVERFKADPKPMHYPDALLCRLWETFKAERDITDDAGVDPDAFAVWGFEQLLHTRIPLYEAIAAEHGYTVEADEVMAVKTPADFVDLIATAIARRTA